ncbi:hypothetical protein CJJ09_004465 [Candidozyma auris]|nr:hypothetical protein CJJ09_004465 [[Candida] auris]
MSDDEYTDILYEVRDRITTITINLDSKLNALNGPQYLQLAKFIDQADKEEDTVVTILQAKGRYFSAGANVRDISVANADPQRSSPMKHRLHVDSFSNLGLVAEGATSATLFLRLGWSKSAEALLFAKPIPGSELNRLGFFNGTFTGKGLTTDQFNEEVHKLVLSKFEGLYEPSIFANKALLRHNRDQLINSANARESIIGFNRWIEGIPQQRFVQIANKEIKHKL